MCRCKSYGSQWRCRSFLSEPTGQPAAGHHDAPQCEQPRVRRNTNMPFCRYLHQKHPSWLHQTRPHTSVFILKIIKTMPSCLSQSDEWCQWGRLHAHSRPSLFLWHEEKLAWGHHAGPTKPLGTQTVSSKELTVHLILFLLVYDVDTSDFSSNKHIVCIKNTSMSVDSRRHLYMCLLGFESSVKLTDCSPSLCLSHITASNVSTPS